MPRKTTKRLDQLPDMPNVFTPREMAARGGLAHCFDAQRPLVLELGCGRGETTVDMAAADPDRNYLGVDIKGARVHRGASAALERGVRNVAFLYSVVEQVALLACGEPIEEIWIRFPDPFPKPSKANRRLTSPRYLELYRRILAPGGRVHFKTDSETLFGYTLEVLDQEKARIHSIDENLADVAGSPAPLAIQSSYECKWRAEGRTIHYVCFSLK